MYEIIDVADVGIFLFVVCGRVALFTRIIKMTEEEISSFTDSGSDSLQDLIYDIHKSGCEDREWQDGRQAIYAKSRTRRCS